MQSIISWKAYAIVMAMLLAVYYVTVYFIFFRRNTFKDKHKLTGGTNPLAGLPSGPPYHQDNDAAVRQ